MSRRILLLCFAGALVTAIWMWSRHALEVVPIAINPQSPTIESSTPQRVTLEKPTARPTPPQVAKRQLPGGPYEPSDPRWQWMREQEKSDPSWEWKRPINFYGKVVDEAGLPIAGASVEFGWTDLSKEGSAKKTTITDNQGLFSLTRQSGKLLQVNISKDGYYTPKRERLKSFEYADFSQANYNEPDPKNPIIFHLKKKGEGEQLISGKANIETSPDGTPVRVDLLNGGRISPDGQLKISAVTNTEKYPPRLFDWQATISIPDGGLFEQTDEFPFEAPTDGYIAQLQFNFPADSPDWKRVVHKNYYITFGSPPKYGKIEIYINGGSQHVRVRYEINPSGSRNLEPSKNTEAFSP